MKGFDLEKLVFFDESGVESNIEQEYGLSVKGERVYGKRSNGRRNRTGILGGIGLDGIKAPFCFQGNIDGEVVEKYFREHLIKELRPGQIVVMDNASYHKRKGIKEAIEEVGCELVFLPTYSPDLNPIEQVWSQLKRLIKKARRKTEISVSEAIDWAFNQICNSNLSQYFQHFSKLLHGSL